MNVTPMIDVLLVLIIIFMVITPTTSHGLNTLVPQASQTNDTPASESHDIVISVSANHSIRLNSESVDLAALQTRLTAIYRKASSRVVFVRGEKDLEYQEIAQVIDLAKGAGAERVGLMTQ
ncbi:MAG TPA: biopolymer transporter ExbD [Bryobacteraceae bacterium]|nr:biopolymer transporter ExbD [Bryobacteraceae bacterium]